MINVKQITSIYSIDILHNMIKPIFGGNLYYMGLTDTMKQLNNKLQIKNVFFGIDNQNIWLNNINPEYIVINEAVIVTNDDVYIAYDSSEDEVIKT